MAQSKKSYKSWSTWVPLLVGLLVAFGLFLFIKKMKAKGQQPNEPELDDDAEKDLTPKISLLSFFQAVNGVLENDYGAKDNAKAALLTAQAAFETGNFTSGLFIDNNNAFGMRQPKVRDTTSIGERNGYAAYATIEDSIKDRLLWDDYNHVSYEGTTVKTFTQTLNKLAYFEAPYLQYQNGVNSYFKMLQSQLSQG